MIKNRIHLTLSILTAAAFALMGLAACKTPGGGDAAATTSSVQAYLPAIQNGAAIATALGLKAEGAQSAAIQPNLYAIAAALRSVSGGEAPTPAAVQAVIAKFTSNTAANAIGGLIAQQLGALYAGYYPSITGNPKLALQVLEALAAGVEAGAAGK